MTGTAKQIAWAEDILAEVKTRAAETRDYYTTKRDEYIAKRKAKGFDDMKPERKAYYDEIFAGLDRMDKYINTVESASEVIEKRNSLLWNSGQMNFNAEAWN